MSSTFDGLRMTARLRSEGYGGRQVRHQLGVAARQRAVDRQPEGHHAHAEQEAAEHVGGEVPAEQDPVEADEDDDQDR